MAVELLEILECPFCGGPLRLDGAPAAGVLNCDCNAYPLVDGIPYLRNGDAADRAIAHVTEGRPRSALLTLLEVDESLDAELAAAATFKAALELLCADAEGQYLLYRFSDPTFLVGDAVVRALGGDRHGRRVLDVCGGAGHLTRSLAAAYRGADVVLIDISFWKLWLATQFVAPGCAAVCSDANVPLPFAAGTFSDVVCSDAFHYIWHKRALARELARAVAPDGTILLPHLHNALSWNYSAGMPLSPEGYLRLFPRGARVFGETPILEGLVEGAPVDLSAQHSEAELADEAALLLVWSGRDGVFDKHERDEPSEATTVNPLYTNDDGALLRTFPSPLYEEEYGPAMDYLPERVDADSDPAELTRRRVLLDLPERYV